MTETTTKTATKKFEPVTFWLADPSLELQIKQKGTRKNLRFANGKLTAKTQGEYDAIKAAGVAFEEDGRDGQPHPASGYNPRSYQAYEAHQNYIPQAQR